MLLFLGGALAGCSSSDTPDSIVGGTHTVGGYLTYTDAATGITWLYDNDVLGGGTDYNTAMQKIAALGDGFRAPDLREFLISFDYDHPDHVLSHLPIELGRHGPFYHTANLRQDGETLIVKVDDGDISKREVHDRIALPVAVYGKLKIKNPTFRDRGNGTIEIPEAQLYALRLHVDCFGALPPALAIQRVAQLQDGMCGLHDGSRPGDWRLPTMNELALIIGDVNQGGGRRHACLTEWHFPETGHLVWIFEPGPQRKLLESLSDRSPYGLPGRCRG